MSAPGPDDTLVFYSLQGLGNSILNFSVFHALRSKYRTRVVAFENGSAQFYRAFHDDVVGVRSVGQLLRTAAGRTSDASFACYPTWRRETLATFATRAKVKYVAGPLGIVPRWWATATTADPGKHDLENNIDLARAAGIDVRPTLAGVLTPERPRRAGVLGIHPTGSTSAKWYPATFWADLFERLDPREIEIYCGTAPAEVAYAARLAESHPRAEVFSGLPFARLTERLATVEQFIGSDSAPMHLSALLGTPTLGLWSFANYRRIHPYGTDVRVYVPEETVAAETFAYPAGTPAYLARASAADVAEILDGGRDASFTFSPARGTRTPFFVF